jgi:hypothetical protein
LYAPSWILAPADRQSVESSRILASILMGSELTKPGEDAD